ncbi:MAG: hypothetical protein L3J08_04015 [Flavobacteriaceae bacterium]|nr:hypothetical protein [Flavobacteriaceae bacterium]
MATHELIGKITVQENVDPIEENKIANTFVVHIPNPLVTYYTWFSEINRPNSVVFITKKPVSFEGILRATKNINNSENLELDGAKCEIQIGSIKYNGIRLKGIRRHSHIEKIQLAYKKEGFDFAKNVKIKNETDALIRLNKFFDLKHISGNIYQSPHNSDRYYIKIPKQISWEEFREHTIKIKNNISVTNFDIAKGIFYENDGIIDMLRIIKPNITIDMVKEIQKKYLDKLL